MNFERHGVRAPIARFSGTQAYRLEGDEVILEAEPEAIDHTAAGRDWALQLWASAGEAEVKVAEVPVGPLAARAPFRGSGLATPPAGAGDYTITMALACGSGGCFDQIHDVVVFPRPVSFLQPRLGGAVGYRFEDDRVVLHVESIDNPRAADSLSGTLSVELWALAAPYGGGAFEGVPVAAAGLGALAGQASWRSVEAMPTAATLPPGEWHLVMMLREWTPMGFMTRDFVNFTRPFSVAPVPAADASTPCGSPVPPAQAVGGDRRVSINAADVDEIAALKGIGEKVARAIVAARPYASLDQITRAKGVGEKTLERLRDRLTL